MFKKIRKYKKGDKFLSKGNYVNIIKLGDEFIVTDNGRIVSDGAIYPINSGFYFHSDNMEYKYEKPLDRLHNIINKYHFDSFIVKQFREREETLTDEELQFCKDLWEEYNKK